MLRISQIKIAIEDEQALEMHIRKKLKLSKQVDMKYTIHKQNIDARDKSTLFFVYSVDVQLPKNKEKEILHKHYKDVTRTPLKHSYTIQKGSVYMQQRPVVVGFGPAGMFAAYVLAKHGYCPIVLERGEDVDKRSKSVDAFFKEGILNEESNIQFGEGGAGTFSDGKLTARSKDPRVQMIYDTLVHFGAPKEIRYESLPHIGSDKLKYVVKKIRQQIIALGGEVHFSSKVESLLIKDEKIVGVKTTTQTYASEHVVLALGNSARDSVRNFYEQGLHMEAKDFAIGVRIEHKQAMIDEALYHTYAKHPSLSAASYFLSDRKGCYTFCMCPGGTVVAATSIIEHVVVNGMSEYARDKDNANSAILVQVDQQVYGEGVFAGMQYIDSLEKEAYKLGGSNYQAPAQLVNDFLEGVASTRYGHVQPSYPLGVKMCNLHTLLPATISSKIKAGLIDFNRKLNGFISDDAILTAIETRSSSPIRIVRDKDTMMANIKGIYPCGEGAGYAGGITSSAIDGVKCAEKIIEQFVYEK